MVKPELRTAITSHSTFSVLKRYTNLVEIGRSISSMPNQGKTLHLHGVHFEEHLTPIWIPTLIPLLKIKVG